MMHPLIAETSRGARGDARRYTFTGSWMALAHLNAQWRMTVPPLQMNLKEAPVSNGVVRVGDKVRELPATHHIQPCACTLCRKRPDEERLLSVHAIGSRNDTVYLVLPGGYECPASEVERVDAA
jgi:hypothetical protein